MDPIRIKVNKFNILYILIDIQKYAEGLFDNASDKKSSFSFTNN